MKTVLVHFDKDLVDRMLSTPDPQTIRLEQMGLPNDDGSYTPTWVLEDMDVQLPVPWVFDGYRRVYDNGVPTSLWQARAVDLTNAEYDADGRMKADFLGGQGKTMIEARDALLEVVRNR